MLLIALLGSLGAGMGLSLGLAFNVRLASYAGHAAVASLVNFVMGGLTTALLWALGFGRGGSPDLGSAPLWVWFGGMTGAAYVTLTLFTARRLGVAASTAAVTLGQVATARAVDHFGLLGQAAHPVSGLDLLGALLLVLAVVLLGVERARSAA